MSIKKKDNSRIIPGKEWGKMSEKEKKALHEGNNEIGKRERIILTMFKQERGSTASQQSEEIDNAIAEKSTNVDIIEYDDRGMNCEAIIHNSPFNDLQKYANNPYGSHNPSGDDMNVSFFGNGLIFYLKTRANCTMEYVVNEDAENAVTRAKASVYSYEPRNKYIEHITIPVIDSPMDIDNEIEKGEPIRDLKSVKKGKYGDILKQAIEKYPKGFTVTDIKPAIKIKDIYDDAFMHAMVYADDIFANRLHITFNGVEIPPFDRLFMNRLRKKCGVKHNIDIPIGVYKDNETGVIQWVKDLHCESLKGEFMDVKIIANYIPAYDLARIKTLTEFSWVFPLDERHRQRRRTYSQRFVKDCGIVFSLYDRYIFADKKVIPFYDSLGVQENSAGAAGRLQIIVVVKNKYDIKRFGLKIQKSHGIQEGLQNRELFTKELQIINDPDGFTGSFTTVLQNIYRRMRDLHDFEDNGTERKDRYHGRFMNKEIAENILRHNELREEVAIYHTRVNNGELNQYINIYKDKGMDVAYALSLPTILVQDENRERESNKKISKQEQHDALEKLLENKNEDFQDIDPDIRSILFEQPSKKADMKRAFYYLALNSLGVSKEVIMEAQKKADEYMELAKCFTK